MEYPSIGTPPSGSIRFNTDSSKMEIYNGDKWWEIDSTSPEAQTGGTRGVFSGGATPTVSDEIDYINIASTGNAADFGNLTSATKSPRSCADRTRLCIGGGESPSVTNTIEYVTISSTGNATNFGDLSVARTMSSSGSNYFRGLWGGGTTPTNSDVIDYITIQATGNAVDFGNLVAATVVPALAGSSTRGIWMGGYPAIGSPSGNQNTIQYVEWSTKGNTADFGDLIAANEGQGACSNAVRMVAGGGYSSSADVNVIQYILSLIHI